MRIVEQLSLAVRGDNPEEHKGPNMARHNKTNKSVAKRFKITGTGKIKRAKCGKRHLNSHMTGKRKRQLGRPGIETGRVTRKYRIALGG